MNIIEQSDLQSAIRYLERLVQTAERHIAQIEELVSEPDNTGAALNYARATGTGSGALRIASNDARYVAGLLKSLIVSGPAV